MRKRFEVQLELGVTPIECIKIPKSRDELPPVIRALQYIYVTPEINEKVFSLLESRIIPKKMGRLGLSLWEILVFGVVRLTLDADYDRLEHTVNYDKLVRDLLGVNTFGGPGKRYPLQTIKDNVALLDEDLINEINEIVVKAGYSLKKKEDEELEIKIDSYVFESNVHFPTDINLLWDSARKSLDMVEKIIEDANVSGWRKIGYWEREIKSAFNAVNRIAFRGGANKADRLFLTTTDYLLKTFNLSKKIKDSKDALTQAARGDLSGIVALELLEYYEQMLDKHIDLVHRRIILDEHIPHEEKIFSIFEPYTEWIKKGKAGNKVELGVKVAVCSDQYGFIVHHRIMEKEQDVDVAIPIVDELLSHWAVKSISFDKGFWSKANYLDLASKVKHLIMPKKGKLNKEEKAREHDPEFIKNRKKHSAIESDINSLEHHGLNRCPDRGKKNFRRYAALGVLSLNLHRLGNILVAEDRLREKQLQNQAA
jgi:hypothetical protein